MLLKRLKSYVWDAPLTVNTIGGILMPRNEDLWEVEQICVSDLFKRNKSDKKCTCPKCTGKKRVGRPRTVEFPELLINATKGLSNDATRT